MKSAVIQTGDPIIGGFRNGYVELGVAALVLSTALAALTYTATEYDGGVSSNNVKKLLSADVPLYEAETLLVKNYVARINFNRSANVRNIPLITATIDLAVVGVVSFVLGTFQATIRPVPWWLAAGAVCVVSSVVFVSGLPTQTYRAIQDVRTWR